MFNFFKKQRKPLFEELCDFHNHLLPGIDDGSKNLDMSMKMLEGFKELGFQSIITSPHVYQELYPNTPSSIKTAFDLLSENIKNSNGPELRSYAAEYMVDEVFMNKLEQETPTLTFNNGYILLEINFFNDTQMLETACFNLCQKNITPILAHPERYHLLKDVSTYEKLKEQGFYFQLNALSLLGKYGPEVKEKAKKLLLAGLYDFVGTDAHHPKHLTSLKSLTLSKKESLKWEYIRDFQLDCFSN
jgi:protein-tyrosine phosphatase